LAPDGLLLVTKDIAVVTAADIDAAVAAAVEQDGVLILEQLLRDDEDDAPPLTTLTPGVVGSVIMRGGPAVISIDAWARATGAVETGALDVALAQKTRAVALPSFLSADEIEAVKQAGAAARVAGAGVEVRSPPGEVCPPPNEHEPVWYVIHMNTFGLFDQLLPGLRSRLIAAARTVDADEGWGLIAPLKDEQIRIRVAEFHRYGAFRYITASNCVPSSVWWQSSWSGCFPLHHCFTFEFIYTILPQHARNGALPNPNPTLTQP
jgi:hypothetical protein